METNEFPLTRGSIDLLRVWLDELVIHDGQPTLRQDGECQFAVEGHKQVEICKAVRIVSGLTAALLLADRGLLVEAASLLRGINDFASEIIFLYEGAPPRQFTAAHREFVAAFFAPIPRTIDELHSSENQRWQNRGAIQNAHDRLAQATRGVDTKELRDWAKLLAGMENSFVHGGYRETMSMYDESSGTFDTTGVLSRYSRALLVRNIAQKVYFSMIAFWFMAMERQLPDLVDRIGRTQAILERSAEYTTRGP